MAIGCLTREAMAMAMASVRDEESQGPATWAHLPRPCSRATTFVKWGLVGGFITKALARQEHAHPAKPTSWDPGPTHRAIGIDVGLRGSRGSDERHVFNNIWAAGGPSNNVPNQGLSGPGRVDGGPSHSLSMSVNMAHLAIRPKAQLI